MKTHLKLARDDSRSDTLLVFLPGAFLKPEEFEREGFINAVRERDLAADALLVDADVSYYYDQSFIDRLHHDILAAATRTRLQVDLAGRHLDRRLRRADP